MTINNIDGDISDSQSAKGIDCHAESDIPKTIKEDEITPGTLNSFRKMDSDDDSVSSDDTDGSESGHRRTKVCGQYALHYYVWRCIRIATQVFICLAILVCVIVSKASFHVIAMIIGNRNNQQFSSEKRFPVIHGVLIYQLTGSLMLPDILKLLSSLWRMMFKSSRRYQNRKQTNLAMKRLSSKDSMNGLSSWSKLYGIIKHVFIECIQCLSMYTFVFTCLPDLNPIGFGAVMAGMPLITSVVTTIKSCIKSSDMRKTNLLNIFFCGSQTIFFIALLFFVAQTFYLKYHNGHIVTMTVMSIALMGMRWLPEEKELNRYYNITNIITSCIRLILPVILIPIFFTNILSVSSIILSIKMSFQNNTNTLSNHSIKSNFLLITDYLDRVVTLHTSFVYVLPLIHMISSFLSYHFAIIACRTRMQRTSFAFPLSIAMPFYTLALLINDLGLFHGNFNNIFGLHPDIQQSVALFGIFVGLWISQLWTCRQIWQKQTINMPDTNRLFDSHSYCGPFNDITLLHSRKKSESDFERLHIKTEAKSLLDRSRRQTNETDIPPMIYVCATMWHETFDEMKMLLTSILSLDHDHASTKSDTCKKSKDYEDDFDFEAHIFFDDAFIESKNGDKMPNQFVTQFQCAIREAVREYYNSNTVLTRYSEQITPYGYRKTWILPGENSLTVHFKDKQLIRNKKRWSQVMYFNYLLKHRLAQSVKVSYMEHEQIVNNAYILALDGDVKFSPMSLKHMLRKMMNNPQIAATTGRLIPCGSGPIIWYQKFEYAVGHWMWKTAEHVFGSVLCASGCFSLYRASALLTGDVLETFATLPASPRDFLQFDQGEDRWLCTLLLKKGFRIDYVAESYAETVAPETLSEFLRQRRRWISSLVANLLDLQECSKVLRRQNSDITLFYMMYLFVISVTMAISPYVTLWVIEISLKNITNLDYWFVYGITYSPIIIHFLTCFIFKSKDRQHNLTAFFTLIYAFIMILLIVAQVVIFKENGFFNISLLYFVPCLLAGILHISQIHNLFYILIFSILSPMGNILIYTYTVCNLDDVSWGTREMKTFGKTNTSAKPDLKPDLACNEQIILNIYKDIDNDNTNGSSLIKSVKSLIKCKLIESLQKLKLDTADKTECHEENDYNSSSESVKEIYPVSKKQSIVDQEKVFWQNLICKCLKPIGVNDNTKASMFIALQKYKTKWIVIYIVVNCGLLLLRKSLDIFRKTLDMEIFTLSFTPIGLILLTVTLIVTFIQIIGLFVFKYKSFLNNVSSVGRIRSHYPPPPTHPPTPHSGI